MTMKTYVATYRMADDKDFWPTWYNIFVFRAFDLDDAKDYLAAEFMGENPKRYSDEERVLSGYIGMPVDPESGQVRLYDLREIKLYELPDAHEVDVNEIRQRWNRTKYAARRRAEEYSRQCDYKQYLELKAIFEPTPVTCSHSFVIMTNGSYCAHCGVAE